MDKQTDTNTIRHIQALAGLRKGTQGIKIVLRNRINDSTALLLSSELQQSSAGYPDSYDLAHSNRGHYKPCD